MDWEKAIEAFVTTGAFPKLRARTFEIRDKERAIASTDKGAGMIRPDMGPPVPSPSSTSATFEDAHKVASKVPTAALFKMTLYGEDARSSSPAPMIPLSLTQSHGPQLGWILVAVGSNQVLSKPLEPTLVNVLFVFNDGSPALSVLVVGEPENVVEFRVKEIFSEGKFEIKIRLGIGEERPSFGRVISAM